MLDSKHRFRLVLIALLMPLAGLASEYDQYKLENGNSVHGWAVAADGERVLFKLKDGTYCFHQFSELADAAKSKIEDLRKEKDIVSLSEYVETSNADPDRLLIPTYDQGSYEQYWGCVANASINFLLWWDKIGVCHVPKEGTEAEKSEWLHDRLYAYVKTFDGEGSNFAKLSRGLKAFFEEYPSDNYTFEYEIVSLKNNPSALAEYAKGLNMTVLMMSGVASGQRKYGHAVSLIQASENKGIVINTYGKTYMAQLYEPCGLFGSSDFIRGTLWEINFSSTCPPDFDSQGYRWTIHNYDQLLVVRPVRRQGAPPKLVDGQSGEASGERAGRFGGNAIFGRDKAIKISGESWQMRYGPDRDNNTSVYVNGEKTDDYILLLTPVKVRYRIPANAAKFVAYGTLPNVKGGHRIENWTWRYVVEIDGKMVFRSDPFNEYEDGMVPISVDIPDHARWMELYMQGMQARKHKPAVWARPEFKKKDL